MRPLPVGGRGVVMARRTQVARGDGQRHQPGAAGDIEDWPAAHRGQIGIECDARLCDLLCPPFTYKINGLIIG